MVHTRNDADRQLPHDSNALRRSYHDSSLAWFALLQPWKLKNEPQFVQRGLFFILPIVIEAGHHFVSRFTLSLVCRAGLDELGA